MTVNFSKYRDELLFLPLGGAGEIGMNMNLYHLDGKWLMVDCGAGFADDYLPGVDMIVPDVEFIAKRREDLLGIVLTHAHEDHLGAVQYVWDELRCPVYATPFTAAFLRLRLKDSDFVRNVKIIEVGIASKLNIGPFALEMVPLNHSAPEMNAIMIRTPKGNVFHTGDWKFDHDPLIGESNNETVLKALGDEGVLAMVGDSTNVFNPGHSGSEGDLRKSLTKLVAGCQQMVVVTTFASNLARIETIMKAAEAAGRRVVVAGKSLFRIIQAAKNSGYLKDIPPMLEDSEMGHYARDKLLVIATGCQGEPMAATSKIATMTHHFIRLVPGDTVIFSSKIIPGNDKRIYRLFNLFAAQKVEVLTEKDHFVHVSGHPGCEELEKMYKLIRPEVAIPVHGEMIHMHEHVKLAKEWGAKDAIEVSDGAVVLLKSGATEKIAVIETNFMAIDGSCLISSDSDILRMRRKMRDSGVVIVSLMMTPDLKLRMRPQIIAPGVLGTGDIDIIELMREEVEHAIEDSNRKVKKQTRDNIETICRSAVRRIISSEIGKKPPIEFMINSAGM